MKISKKVNKHKSQSGFTLVELVVVLAGLAALGAFAIPNVLNSIKLNRIEEAKALMNSYASDCVGKFRVSTDPLKFSKEAVPDDLDNEKLATLGYKIDGNKTKCNHTAITPLDKDDTFLYAFDFRVSSEGKVTKTATPSDNRAALTSCKSWAGKNCGLSEEQKAEFERQEKLAQAKSKCISDYQTWLSKDSTGSFFSWDKEKETCTNEVFAFEGTPVASKEAIEEALKAKYGSICSDWQSSKKANKSYKSPGGNGETKNPECGGNLYWFHSGEVFTNKAKWTEYDNLLKKQACDNDRDDSMAKKKKGQYTYGPSPGPAPCGQVVWLCDGKEYLTLDSYKTSSCGAPPPEPKPEPIKKPLPVVVDPVTRKEVTCPGSKPTVCNNAFLKWRVPTCKCWNNL